MALFFILCFLLFCPLKFVFEGVLDFVDKCFYIKSKFYNMLPVFSNKLSLDGIKIVDKRGKQKKLFDKNSKIDVKKFFKLVRLNVMAVWDFAQDAWFVFLLNEILTWLYGFYGEKVCLFAKNIPKTKIIVTNGIVYTCFANIIFKIVLQIGVSLWKLLKIKLKKSLMG